MFLVETLPICFVAFPKKPKNDTNCLHKCFCQLLYSQFYAIIIIGILYAHGELCNEKNDDRIIGNSDVILNYRL